MVVSIVLCPQMIERCGGGSPLMIASVTKIFLKSWGRNQRFAGGVGEPAGGECVDEQFADRAGCEGAVLVADRRRNSSGIGGFQTRSRMS